MADLTRRRQRPRMETVREDASTATEHTVHGSRQSDRQPADPIRQRPPMFRLRDQMKVVALHGKLDEAELGAIGFA